MLCRGVVHIEFVGQAGPHFDGDKPESAELFVHKVRAAVNTRFRGEDKLDVLFTDKGPGFYVPVTSIITDEYKSALDTYGLKAFGGDDNRIQPGNMQEVMLHETVVAWMRVRLSKTTPQEAWTETEDAYAKRLKTCAAYINDHYKVKELCLEFPQRLAKILQADGGRIKK